MTDVRLAGCKPAPLAHYLKALGILRLVTEQADRHARGWWEADAFVLRSNLDREELVAFFAERVAPTPIIGPWNGASGFFPSDSQDGIGAIEVSDGPRFAPYRAAIAAARGVLARLGVTEKPEKEQKARVIEELRAALPDDAVQWIDSALALTAEGPKFPPLLGTGGNDGHLDFTNNQMQRWAELLLAEQSPPRSWLQHALFDENTSDLPSKRAIGQFHPSGAGGYNMASGFDRKSLINPWTYVLMLEGALLFASSVNRRLEDTRAGALVYPFTVRAAGVGYASASLADEDGTRNEVWLPEWARPSHLSELQTLFAEGRARVRTANGSRPVESAVDFARAIQDLGTQRGVTSFHRFGFHKRQGLSYLAVPLGRWQARSQAQSDLLAPLDTWLQSFRRGAKRDNAPASIRRALARVESATLELCGGETPGKAQALLVALGDAERVLASSMKFTKEAFLRPVHGVGVEWIDRADDGSVEWRLALALAAAGLRGNIVPVRRGSWAETSDGDTVWGEGELVPNLLAVLRRRALHLHESQETSPPPLALAADDLTAFLEGSVDDRRLAELLRAASLIDLRQARTRTLGAGPRDRVPPYAFAACALVWSGQVPIPSAEAPVALPPSPTMVARLVAGDGTRAVAEAQRRLHGSGFSLRSSVRTSVVVAPTFARRMAAALLFPLSPRTRRALANLVLVHEEALSESP